MRDVRFQSRSSALFDETMKGRVLIIAGSDPSGGAGVQADIKTVTALDGYAATAITALTVQNTLGVSAVHGVDAEIIHAQIRAVIDDIGVDAVKIGMVGGVEATQAIAQALNGVSAPIVLDPVLAATSGDALAADGVADAIMEMLAPTSTVITPNIPEAERLARESVASSQAQARAGERLLAIGAGAALVKGGHLDGDRITDVLVTPDGVEIFEKPRVPVAATHGTGCTLASALATGLAQGESLVEATRRAIEYVDEAIRTAPGFGGGAGPLNHAHTVKKFKSGE